MKLYMMIALLAALCLLFCGCAGTQTGDEQTMSTTAETETDAQASILGNWRYETTVKGIYGESFQESFTEADNDDVDDPDEADDYDVDLELAKFVYERMSDQAYVFDITFGEDGICRVSQTKDSAEKMNEAARALWPEMLAIMYRMSVDEMEEALAADGLTMDYLIELNIGDLREFTQFADLASGKPLEFSYFLEGNQLTCSVGDESIVYAVSVSDSKLTAVDIISGLPYLIPVGSSLTRAG